ncbi:MAG: RNA 2',3'-cyclic phosphodiesterase [Thiobacillaceae bacterium]
MSQNSLKLFFALWPEEDVRRALWKTSALLQEVWNGRRTKPDSLHMTLVFLGETPAGQLEELRQLAARMQAKSFKLLFKQAACWRHNKVGFLNPAETPPELAQLVYGLEDSLESAGINFDQRPYKPHITLLRNTRCTTQVSFEPITWSPQEFVLVASIQSDHGQTYQLVGRWKLNP